MKAAIVDERESPLLQMTDLEVMVDCLVQWHLSDPNKKLVIKTVIADHSELLNARDWAYPRCQ